MSSTLSGPPRRGRGRLRLVTPPPASVHGGRLRRDDDHGASRHDPDDRYDTADGREDDRPYREDGRRHRGDGRRPREDARRRPRPRYRVEDHDSRGYDDGGHDDDGYDGGGYDDDGYDGGGHDDGYDDGYRAGRGSGRRRSDSSGEADGEYGDGREDHRVEGGRDRRAPVRRPARGGSGGSGAARSGGGSGGRRVYRPGTAGRLAAGGQGGRGSSGGRSGPVRGAGGRRPPVRRRRPPRSYRLGSPRRRVRATVVFMCVLLGILAVRLTQLQGISASTYAAQAEAQRLRTIVLPAARGSITDRSGHTLAQHVELRAVYANPQNVRDAHATAVKLSPLLGVDAATLGKRMTVEPDDDHTKFVYLARGLTPDVGDKVTKLELRGIGITEERGRTYPAGALAANVVGFMRHGDGDVLKGGGGLELAYDKVLRGTDGLRQLLANPEGIEIPSGHTRQKDPEPGSALRLTLDRDIQWNAQNAIAEAVTSSQADGGTVVVTVPRSGDILAMADAPQFDPNHITAQDTKALGNRATQDAYEPGSVNKVITMAAALDRGLVTAETPMTVPPSITRGGVPIRDAEPHGVEHLTTAGVLARSSNIGTVEVADKVGRAGLEQALRAFGLGAKTGLDFPGEGAGLLPPSKDWSGSQVATISYGQGMSATALQMASVYATIANGGVRVTPRLVDAITGPDGKVQPMPHPPGQRVVSAQTASTLTRMLEAVATNEGTAPLAEVPGYRVAGKTGTADRPDPVHGGYEGHTSSFIGFAPADNPRVVVEVVLDNPKNGYFGGQVAAPVFQKVMSFALTTLGVPQPTTKPAPLVLDLDK
ncbi:Cell division protein [Frankia canadensis]|uniref:Cell division protein n=1 Tax=Frankia canadensis TaxID=1836972 RepID=A0A2I2KJ09_9ACTN|nr:penicillin-binding protein 2 [Frankia canadensis]SNQ45644.1 Cell division protein [Frankia canadensis]SOU52934.1 Cell division protein [Frankia canadensis]